MSTLVGIDNSVDSSNSFIEIDNENINNCNNNSLSSHEEDDTKPIVDRENSPVSTSPPISFKNNTNNNHYFGLNNNSNNNSSTMGGISIPHHGLSAAFHGYHSNVNNNNKSSPFLLPAQLYKSLFANAVLQNPDKLNGSNSSSGGGTSVQPFPRNLLFSCAEKSPNSDDNELEEKCSIGEEVKFIYSVYFEKH